MNQPLKSVFCQRPEEAFVDYPKWVREDKLRSQAPIEEVYKRRRYDTVSEHLFELFGECLHDVEEFKMKVTQLRLSDRKKFNELLEWVFNDDDVSLLPREDNRIRSKNIKFNVAKYKHCEQCGRVFYDLSRNGRTKVCHYEIHEKWDAKNKRYTRLFNSDGTFKSVCQVKRDNATARSSYNRLEKGVHSSNYVGDGTLMSGKITESTRKRIERKFFRWFPQVAQTEKEQKFLHFVESSFVTLDPQDIVCGTTNTCRVYKPSKTRFPSNLSDSNSAAFFKIGIQSAEKEVLSEEVKGQRVVFENKLLDIKKELPKQPKQR